MHQSARILGRALLVAAAVCSLATLPGCREEATPAPEVSAEEEYAQARQQLVRAGQRLVSEAGPVTDREALARQLQLSADRFGVIKTGDQATEPIVLAFDQSKDCSGRYCTCVGDKDCNEMFSGVCASPSTDGVCQIRGDTPMCRCQVKAD